MKLAAPLLFLTASLFMARAARATPVVYNIATTQVFLGGPVSGTLSGTGTTLTSYNFTATNGSSSLTFDNTLPGQTGTIMPFKGITLPDGTPLLFAFIYDTDTGSSVQFSATGSFTNGLVFDPVGTLSNVGPLGGFAVVTSAGTFVEDNISLTQQPPAATPEPSSLVLLASGLVAVGAQSANRRRVGFPLSR